MAKRPIIYIGVVITLTLLLVGVLLFWNTDGITGAAVAPLPNSVAESLAPQPSIEPLPQIRDDGGGPVADPPSTSRSDVVLSSSSSGSSSSSSSSSGSSSTSSSSGGSGSAAPIEVRALVPVDNSIVHTEEEANVTFACDSLGGSGFRTLSLSVFNTTDVYTTQNQRVEEGAIALWTVPLKPGAYNWTCTASDVGDSDTSEVRSLLVNQTPFVPRVFLSSPKDNYPETDGTITFTYQVTSPNPVGCDFSLNGVVNQTTASVPTGVDQAFTIHNISVGRYVWDVSCRDNASVVGRSEGRRVSVFKFSEELSIPLENVELDSVPNVVLNRTDLGTIRYLEDLNLTSGGDIEQHISIEHNFIRVDSESIPHFNRSAELTFHQLTFQNPVVFRNGEPCGDCDVVSYQAGSLAFTVSHFSNYTTAENAQLLIFDDSDTNEIFANQQFEFSANYTNTTSNAVIAGQNCNITFGDTGTSAMTFNSTTNLSTFNRSFSTAGVFFYNVTCGATNFATLNGTDTASISASSGPVRVRNITNLGSQRRTFSGSSSESSHAGNTTGLVINSTGLTSSWQGFYGNINFSIQLGNPTSLFYEWDATTLLGETYASRALDVNFATINCSTTAQISAEEGFIGHTTGAADSVNRTFNRTDHPAFQVGTLSFSANQCRSTNLFVNDAAQTTSFYEVLLSDGASNMVYTAIIDQDDIGFDGNTYDFQLIVGENGANSDTTPYFFFVEIG